jgi:hypothetical protein
LWYADSSAGTEHFRGYRHGMQKLSPPDDPADPGVEVEPAVTDVISKLESASLPGGLIEAYARAVAEGAVDALS